MTIDKEVLKKITGKAINERREELGLTQEELGLRVISERYKKGSSRQYIGWIETGKHGVSLMKFIQFCEALEITPVEMFNRMFPES